MATTVDNLRLAVKRNDRARVVRATVMQDGAPLDFTGWTNPQFLMRAINDTVVKVSATAVIEDATGGVLRYDWAAGDTDTAGLFVAEFRVDSPGSLQHTFPVGDYDGNGEDRYIYIRIWEDIDNA